MSARTPEQIAADLYPAYDPGGGIREAAIAGARAAQVAPDFTELRKCVAAAQEAAEGSSNDEEIEALQEALDAALTMLGYWEANTPRDEREN